MFQATFVKPAFHMAWFVLILGGASLFEKGGWGIPGAIMLLYGLGVLAYTAFAIYLHKPLLKKPSLILMPAMFLLVVLIVAHVIFEHYMLAMILAALGVPVLVGYFRIKGKSLGDSPKPVKR
jgi:hypothetical protein